MAKRRDWTPPEIEQCLMLYIKMHNHVRRGERYNKAAMVREAIAGGLSGRTRGAVEQKLMNITAVLEQHGYSHLSMAKHGYLPLPKYQAALKHRVLWLLEDSEVRHA